MRARRTARLLRHAEGPRRPAPWPLVCVVLQRADVLRLRALLALSHVELDALVLVEGLVPLRLDRREVAEDVGAAVVLGDEPKALLRVEPLHSALSHAVLFPYWGPPRRSPGRDRRTT